MSQIVASVLNSAIRMSPSSAAPPQPGKIDIQDTVMCAAFGGKYCKQQQNFGSSMQINNMYRTSAPCSQNPLQPECFSGKLAGTKACKSGSGDCLKSYSAPQAMHASSARATEHFNGSVVFSTLKPEDIASDPDFPVESLAADGTCFDCSTVDQATFMKQCVRDSNVGAATLKLAPCSTKANRDVNQDQGSRQPERISTRENTVFNLTDAKYAEPLVTAQAANATMLVHTGAPTAAGAVRADKILGNMSPAISIPMGASRVGRL